MVLRRWAAPQHIMDGASQKETSSPCSSACGASPPDRCCWLKESGFCLEHAGTTMKGGGFTSQSCLLGLAGCWHSQGRHLSISQAGALTTVWRKFSLSAFKSWGVTPQLLSNMCSACEITLVLYSPTFLWRWRSQVFGLRLLNTEWMAWMMLGPGQEGNAISHLSPRHCPSRHDLGCWCKAVVACSAFLSAKELNNPTSHFSSRSSAWGGT